MQIRRWVAAAAAGATLVGIIAPTASAAPDLRAGQCLGHGPRAQAECRASLLPARYTVMDMGVPVYGGGPSTGHAHHGIGVDDLRGPATTPDFTYTLVAAMGQVVIDGRSRPAMTFNGTTPGPTLTVTQGDLVEVRLENRDVARGVSVHFHGIDLPGGEDGVAGVTQDAVLPGRSFTYRFVVPDAGTYWYHSHQDSVREVGLGLLGAFVVLPRTPEPPPVPTAPDVVAVVHTYGSTTTVNGSTVPEPVVTPIGSSVRVRVVNADNGPALVASSAPYRVVAIDGTEMEGATEVTDTYVVIPAGGRIDISLKPGAATRVGLLVGPTLVIGSSATTSVPPPLAAHQRFDPLTYGTPGTSAAAAAAIGRADRRFTYRVGSRVGYLDGRRGTWFTIDGRIIPHVPMFIVRLGDVVRYRVVNRTAGAHPMHLHGHHALVIARNGKPATGAPWWVDSLEVDPGESYDLLFVADNPGIWMFHCHNLPHARRGLMTHLMYEGVTTPFAIGPVGGGLVNQPE